MSRILLIEDDQKIADLLKEGLEKENFLVEHCASGSEVTAFLALKPNLSLIILDLMLPDVDGLELLKNFREKNIMVPVLILSAKTSVDDRISGLRAGGDDYLIKPFAFAELLARIEAIIRRNEIDTRTAFIRFESITLNLLDRTVLRDEVQIELHAKEFLLLELFVRNPSKIFSKKMILEEVYGTTLKAQSNLVDVLVFRLRNKIDRPFSKKYIHTVHGLGYLFEAH